MKGKINGHILKSIGVAQKMDGAVATEQNSLFKKISFN
jgi:hypothetical protein